MSFHCCERDPELAQAPKRQFGGMSLTQRLAENSRLH